MTARRKLEVFAKPKRFSLITGMRYLYVSGDHVFAGCLKESPVRWLPVLIW